MSELDPKTMKIHFSPYPLDVKLSPSGKTDVYNKWKDPSSIKGVIGIEDVSSLHESGTSIVHEVIKFPTPEGIMQIRWDLLVVTEMFVVSLTKDQLKANQ
ncbi:hypothetical protein HAX54_047130, partial [Datura stramonium]|nr:hypothetical protein [Datura stramonium]